MNWNEMIKEMLLDIEKIITAEISVRYMVGVVQWRGALMGRAIYQLTPDKLNDSGGSLRGMSMIPKPSDWKTIALGFVPTVNGAPSEDDMPMAYYVISEKGNSVAFPARFNRGQVAWTGSREVIDHVGEALLVADLLNMAKVGGLGSSRAPSLRGTTIWIHKKKQDEAPHVCPKCMAGFGCEENPCALEYESVCSDCY